MIAVAGTGFSAELTSADVIATSAIVSAVVAIISIGLYIWYAFALSKLFPKLDQPGWKGWVPVLNEATILQIGGRPAWNVVFYFVPVLQLYGIYLKVLATHSINKRFGRGAGFTALAVLLPPLWATLLAWGAPPYPDGDRLANLHGVRRQGADAGRTVGVQPAQGYLAAPIPHGGTVPPVAPGPQAPGAFAPAPPASFAPAPPASFAPVADPALPQRGFVPQPPAAPPVAFTDPRYSDDPAPDATIPAPYRGTRVPDAPAPAAPVAPALPIAQGLIDSVPGAVAPAPAPSAPAPAPAAVPAPAPLAPAPPAVEVPAPPAVVPVAEPVAAASESIAEPPRVREATPVTRAERAAALRPVPVEIPVPELRAPAPVDDDDDDDLEATVVVKRSRGPRRVLVLDDGRTFALSATSIVIGRNPDGDPGEQRLAIPDKTRTLSKTHARLVVQGDEWRLTDLHSTNGVVVVADDGAETLLDAGESVTGAGRFVLGEVGMHVAMESSS